MAQSFALLALGDFPARPKVNTPALLDDLAAVIADGAKHVPELRCRYLEAQCRRSDLPFRRPPR